MADREIIELTEFDFFLIEEELQNTGVSDKFDNPRLSKLADRIRKGAKIAVHRNWYSQLVKLVNDYCRGDRISGSVRELNLRLVHDVSADVKNVFEDILVTLVPSDKMVGRPRVPVLRPEDPPRHLIEMRHVLKEALLPERGGWLVLVAGAGIDPQYTKILLDCYYKDRTRKNLAGEKVSDRKRALVVVLNICQLLWADEWFATAHAIAGLTNKISNMTIITTNWSHSLERHGSKNTRNLRKFTYDNTTRTVEVGTRHLDEINDFIDGERDRNHNGKLWLFVVGSALRGTDFRSTPLSRLLGEAEGIVVNDLHDKRSVSEMIHEHEPRVWPPKYVLIAESASALFCRISAEDLIPQ
jgi:hypothetical protein